MTRFLYLKSGQEVLVDDADYEWLSEKASELLHVPYNGKLNRL